MTLCVGVHQGSQVLVLADAAITVRQEARGAPATSVGEAPLIEEQRSVIEGAQKVVALHNGIVSYAGEVAFAEEVIEVLGAALKGGFAFSEAAEATITSLGPFPDGPPSSCHLLISLPGSDGPSLYRWYFGERPPEMVRPGGLVAVGSRPEAVDHFLAHFHRGLTRDLGVDDRGLLAMWLGALTQLTLHKGMMSLGIGGMWHGARVTSDTAEFHADTLFLFGNGSDLGETVETAYCVNRDGHSLFSGSLRGGNISTADPVWREKWLEALTNFHDDAVFDYVVFVDRARPHSSVFEMKGDLRRPHLAFVVNEEKVSFTFSPRAEQQMAVVHPRPKVDFYEG